MDLFTIPSPGSSKSWLIKIVAFNHSLNLMHWSWCAVKMISHANWSIYHFIYIPISSFFFKICTVRPFQFYSSGNNTVPGTGHYGMQKKIPEFTNLTKNDTSSSLLFPRPRQPYSTLFFFDFLGFLCEFIQHHFSVSLSMSLSLHVPVYACFHVWGCTCVCMCKYIYMYVEAWSLC